MSKWIKVAVAREVAPGTAKVIEAEGQSIALFNVGGVFFAIDSVCTHQEGPLGEGELAGAVVTCPWHAAEFNVKTDEALCPPATDGVRTFPVKVEGDDVLVELD